MKKIKITTKISIATLAFVSVAIISVWLYFDSLLKENYYNDAKVKIAHAKSRVLSDFNEQF